MISIADCRMPEQAMLKLEKLGSVMLLEPQPRVYPAIAAHPDIFFCQTPFGLVHAPNLAPATVSTLKQQGIKLIRGEKQPGAVYPETAIYNALATEKYLLHNMKHTDAVLKQQYAPQQQLHLKQGYTRCNLMEVGPDAFVTVDAGIAAVLRKAGLDVFLCSTLQVQLAGFDHGFFPGCCGIYKDTIFVCGDPEILPDYNALATFCNQYGKRLKALYNGPLMDVGSILMLD